MSRHFLIMLLLIMTYSTVFADPAPFGMEINKSTYQEVKEKYSGTHAGINKYSKGKTYRIDSDQIDMEGIKNISAIFSKEGTLLALVTTFDKSKYYALMDSLNQKYELISERDPFVGDKFARFQDGNTTIYIDASHMRFDLLLVYADKDFYRLQLNQVRQEKEQKKDRERDSL